MSDLALLEDEDDEDDDDDDADDVCSSDDGNIAGFEHFAQGTAARAAVKRSPGFTLLMLTCPASVTVVVVAIVVVRILVLETLLLAPALL